jgi:pimeloyl-ACP methyl ester carboxylesterase
VNTGSSAEAQLPPNGLVGLDSTWSRLVTDTNGHTWHVLDNDVAEPRVALLCVHGNPSWSFLWRNVIAAAPADVRVIAVDQLDMGFSERTGKRRPLATRVDDLCSLTAALSLTGPVVTVAHDWGGPISLGWAQRHRDQVVGVVLLNTAVHQPDGSPVPSIIRLIRRRGMLRKVTVDTAAFITGAIKMSKPALSADVTAGLRAPYATAGRRQAIQHFVEDIPLDPAHESAAALDAIAAGLADFADVSTLLMWGPRDPVFSDLYLHDLERRLPHADVHRFVGASHLVSEDVDVVTPLFDWLEGRELQALVAHDDRSPIWAGLTLEFGDEVKRTALGMAAAGISPGDRVALMIPPGDELSLALYSCWRLGAVAVLIDSGLGPKGMSRAMAGAAPDHLIGIDRALTAAKALRWPGRRLSVRPKGAAQRRALGVAGDLASMASHPTGELLLPLATDDAAIVFTSGSTGPSKGVRYCHHQVQAQPDHAQPLKAVHPWRRC